MNVDKVTNGRGLVSEKTLAELQKLQLRFEPEFRSSMCNDTKYERIPQLHEVLQIVKDFEIDVIVDVKEHVRKYEKKSRLENFFFFFVCR